MVLDEVGDAGLKETVDISTTSKKYVISNPMSCNITTQRHTLASSLLVFVYLLLCVFLSTMLHNSEFSHAKDASEFLMGSPPPTKATNTKWWLD